MNDKRQNLLNKKFGSLLVIDYAKKNDNKTCWLCECDCGNQIIVKAYRLKSKRSVTCGCRINKFPNKDPKLSSAKIVYDKLYKDGDITFEQFYELSQQNCYYCNSIPSNYINKFNRKSVNKKRKNTKFSDQKYGFVYNGLDRIDSSKKHLLDNVVPCCKNCNTAKSTMSINDFKKWIIKVYNFWAKEKSQH